MQIGTFMFKTALEWSDKCRFRDHRQELSDLEYFSQVKPFHPSNLYSNVLPSEIPPIKE